MDGLSQFTCDHCDVYYTKKYLEKHDAFFFLLDVANVLRFVLEVPENGEEVLRIIEERNASAGVKSKVYRDIVDGDAYKAYSMYCKMEGHRPY